MNLASLGALYGVPDKVRAHLYETVGIPGEVPRHVGRHGEQQFESFRSPRFWPVIAARLSITSSRMKSTCSISRRPASIFE